MEATRAELAPRGCKRVSRRLKKAKKSDMPKPSQIAAKMASKARLVLLGPAFWQPMGLKRVQDDHKKHIKKGIQNGIHKLTQNGFKMEDQNPIKTSQEASNKGSFLGLVLGTPKRDPREAQERPKRAQEGTQAQESPRGAKRSPRRPKRRPGDPKRATRDFQESPTKPKRCRRPPQRV